MAATLERGFILAEDQAMKAKLSNIIVRDRDGERRVKTWFGFPGSEVERSYPYITINLIDISFAADRAHSAQLLPVDYWPSEYSTFPEYAASRGIDFNWVDDRMAAMWFLPYDLIYQVTTHARYTMHDRQMLMTLLRTPYLPFRFGFLDVPQDGSIRHLTLEDWTPAHRIDEKGEREFRTVYTVRVSAEMAPEDPLIFLQVLSVHAKLFVTNSDIEPEEWDIVPPPESAPLGAVAAVNGDHVDGRRPVNDTGTPT